MPRSRRIGRALAVSLSLALLASTLMTLPSAQAASTRKITLGGVKVTVSAYTKQVITVNRTSGTKARVTYWRKTSKGWDARRTTKYGRIGYGGLVTGSKRKQGTGTTPLGTYKITESFGNAAKPAGTTFPFHRVRKGDYWVQDNGSRYYNYLRNSAQGGFRTKGSEYLRRYEQQYAWSLVIDFNRPHAVKKRGSGIFLHVNGKGATAGCVSAPKWFIKDMTKLMRKKFAPRIAIGR